MQKIEFTTSLLTFYLKGSIEGDEHFINFKVPNTILGMIPLGARTDNLATNQISSTTTNFKLQIKQLLIGLFIFLLGIDLLNDSFIIALIAKYKLLSGIFLSINFNKFFVFSLYALISLLVV